MRIKKNHLFITILFAFALSSCSSSKNYYLGPAYDANNSKASLLVVTALQSWFSNFPYHVFGKLRGMGKTTFIAYLDPLFSQFTTSEVQIISSSAIEPEDFEITRLSINQNKFYIISPKINSSIGTRENLPRFILILDQFYFKVKAKKKLESRALGYYETTYNKVLYFETKYAYWDRRKKKMVGWGTTSANKSIIKKPKGSDYFKLLSQVFRKIVRQGPLKMAS